MHYEVHGGVPSSKLGGGPVFSHDHPIQEQWGLTLCGTQELSQGKSVMASRTCQGLPPSSHLLDPPGSGQWQVYLERGLPDILGRGTELRDPLGF